MTITYTSASGTPYKPCSRCGVVKPLSSYYRHKTGKEAGTYYWCCKACCSEICAAYEATHREERTARTREWVAANPERYRTVRKARRDRAKGLPPT